MANKIEPGSLDDPAGPDMSRYYYPSGATEPVLKPEHVSAPAEEDAGPASNLPEPERKSKDDDSPRKVAHKK